MNKIFRNIIIFISVVIIIFIIYKIIKILHTYNNIKKALNTSFFNTYECGQKRCPSTSPIPLFPSNIDLINWNVDIAKYSAELVYRIEKAALEKKKIQYLPGITVLKELYNNSNDPVFGSIMKNNNVIFIGLRGTLTQEEWFEDFDINQNNYKKNVPVTQVKFKIVGETKPPLIHSGFMDTYSSIKNDIMDTLKKYNPDKKFSIIVTGHSLGAAVATILGLDLAKNKYSAVVYNFASPRVGDQIFSNIVNNSIKVFRVVNISDLVPTLPTSVTPNLNDINKPYFYSHCGILKTFENNWSSVLNNHLIPIYMKALETMS